VLILVASAFLALGIFHATVCNPFRMWLCFVSAAGLGIVGVMGVGP